MAVDTSLSDPRASPRSSLVLSSQRARHSGPGLPQYEVSVPFIHYRGKRGPCELWPAVASKFQITRTSSRVEWSA